jgi:hypothetical protein
MGRPVSTTGPVVVPECPAAGAGSEGVGAINGAGVLEATGVFSAVVEAELFVIGGAGAIGPSAGEASVLMEAVAELFLPCDPFFRREWVAGVVAAAVSVEGVVAEAEAVLAGAVAVVVFLAAPGAWVPLLVGVLPAVLAEVVEVVVGLTEEEADVVGAAELAVPEAVVEAESAVSECFFFFRCDDDLCVEVVPSAATEVPDLTVDEAGAGDPFVVTSPLTKTSDPATNIPSANATRDR